VRVADEAERLGLTRALVIATPGSGVRLGKRIVENLAGRAAGLHAQAVMHVPKPWQTRASPPRAMQGPMAWSRPAAAPPSGSPRSSRATGPADPRGADHIFRLGGNLDLGTERRRAQIHRKDTRVLRARSSTIPSSPSRCPPP